MSSLPVGTVHNTIPTDFYKLLINNKKAQATWCAITPLARNEWICWIISPKQSKTRDEHTRRATNELAEGKRRPCCWIGCTHRTDKAISPSVKWVLSKKK